MCPVWFRFADKDLHILDQLNASVNDKICLPLADVLTMHHTRPHNFVYKVNSVNGVQRYIKNS